MNGRLHDSHIPEPILHPLRYLPTLILLGLAVHLLLPQITAFEHSISVLKQMALWAVAFAFIVQICSYLGFGFLYKSAARITNDHLPLTRATLISIAAPDIGLVAGGAFAVGAAVYKWVKASGVSQEGSVLAGTLPWLFNNLLMVVLSVFGLLHLLVAHNLSNVEMVAFIVILALLGSIIGSLLWGLKHREGLTRFFEKIQSRWARFRKRDYDPAVTDETVERIFATWDALKSGGWKYTLLGSVMTIGFDILTLYFIFLASGNAISPGVLLVGYGLPLLIGRMGFIPGGVGIVEGMMATLYTSLGVPNGVSVVVIIAYRAVSFWIPTLIGFPLILFLERKTHTSFQTDSE